MASIILETPLFKVRNKEKTFYCYSEEERDKAIEKLKKGVEVPVLKDWARFLHMNLSNLSAKIFV